MSRPSDREPSPERGSLIGFLGLGEMGRPMVRNLLQAQYRVLVFDPIAERLDACARLGAGAASSPEEVVRTCSVYATSLTSAETWLAFAEGVALPLAWPGQITVDLGTVGAHHTRRIAALLQARGAALVDAPVSGGPYGVENRALRVFVGGDPASVQRVWPVLVALAGPDLIVRCGPSGAGQAVKGANQLGMGLGAAAYLEAVAYAVGMGVDPAIVEQALGGDEPWRRQVAATARAAAEGEAENVGVKYRELPYYIEAAASVGGELPIATAVRAFMEQGEPVVMDDHRFHPSYWHELMRRMGAAPQER